MPILRYSLLRARRQGSDVPLLLPSDYHFMVPKSTRSIAGQVCSCRLCALGSLSGRAFLQFKWDMRARREGRGRLDKVTRMCPSCFQGVVDNKSHVCKVSTKEAVQNLVEALPDELAAKVVHSYLAKQVEGGGSQVLLQLQLPAAPSTPASSVPP